MSQVVEFSTLTEMFENVTLKFLNDERPAMMYKTQGRYKGVSYRDLRTAACNFSLGLASMGAHRGDRVAIISENRPEWVIADMGATKIGAVTVPVYPTLTPTQVGYILNDAGARFVVVSNQLQLGKVLKVFHEIESLEKIIVTSERGIPEHPDVLEYRAVISAGEEFGKLYPNYLDDEMKKARPEDLLTIIYTSGTTGSPKGVMLTHRNLVSNMQAAAACIPFASDDLILSYLPLSHSYERMAGYYTAMSCGVTIAYAESIETVAENLTEVRPTVVTTVPRLFERFYTRIMKSLAEQSRMRCRIFHWAIGTGRRYAEASRRGGSVPVPLSLGYRLADRIVFSKIKERTGGRIRFFVSGAAALTKEMGEFFESVGIKVIEGYGMTECSPVISVNRLDDYRFGTVGKPIPGVCTRIAEDGEILVKGPNVMAGYWNNESATREVIDPDGWLHTGDLGVIDSDGFITITDRKKHLFVSSGGKNISPQHIEDLFLRSNFIDQFILIGDGRMFLSALIVPDFDIIRRYAQRNGIIYASLEDLVNKPETYRLMEEELGKIQKDLASYERVRKFTILSRPLSLEDGEITPTMKVRRKVIEEKFSNVIEKMYEPLR